MKNILSPYPNHISPPLCASSNFLNLIILHFSNLTLHSQLSHHHFSVLDLLEFTNYLFMRLTPFLRRCNLMLSYSCRTSILLLLSQVLQNFHICILTLPLFRSFSLWWCIIFFITAVCIVQIFHNSTTTWFTLSNTSATGSSWSSTALSSPQHHLYHAPHPFQHQLFLEYSLHLIVECPCPSLIHQI